MAAQHLEANSTKHLEGHDDMSTDPDPHYIPFEGLLPNDDVVDYESMDLWLPPLDCPESSPQLSQQLPQQQQQQQRPPPTGAEHINAQQQYVSKAPEAVHLPPHTLPTCFPSQSQPQLPRIPAERPHLLTVLQGSSYYMPGFAPSQPSQVANKPNVGMTPQQRMAAIASNFQQKTTVFVRPAPAHAAAHLLDMAKQLMPTRGQKTIDAAVLWAALCKYPNKERHLYRAKHFAEAAGVSSSTLSTVSSKLLNNVKFTTELHLEMYRQWVASGDSEVLFSSEREPASRGTKRGRDESALASSPPEQIASDAEDGAVFFPVMKKIHVDGGQLADDQTGIPADSCQPTSGQLLLVLLTRHCKKHLINAMTCVIVPDVICANCVTVFLFCFVFTGIPKVNIGM